MQLKNKGSLIGDTSVEIKRTKTMVTCMIKSADCEDISCDNKTLSERQIIKDRCFKKQKVGLDPYNFERLRRKKSWYLKNFSD